MVYKIDLLDKTYYNSSFKSRVLLDDRNSLDQNLPQITTQYNLSFGQKDTSTKLTGIQLPSKTCIVQITFEQQCIVGPSKSGEH